VNRIRHVAWIAGAPVRVALIAVIKLYRLTLSGVLGGQCRFYPSCSHYGETAIRTHGAAKGSAMAAWRILRCHPFSAGGVEHVPPARGRHSRYEDVIQHGGRA
jgi:putative membrane protein insertion efficiency factor